MLAAVAVLAASGGYLVAMRMSAPSIPGLPAEPIEPSALPSGENLLGQRRPDFSLADATGQWVSADSFNGQVLLVNFWATWCKPCVEEMPMLAQVQQDYAGQGVAVIGIALDDPRRAQEFARELGIGYPVLFGRADAMVVGRRYGNRSGMLPYSVLVDSGGVIRWTRLGILDRGELEAQLAALR
jgi:thiol-disulfide isomerase/thioredoxin